MADLSEYVEQLKNFDISDVDWERIGVWPLPGRIFLCILAISLIIGGAFFLFVKEKNLQLERAETKESSLRREFEKKAFEAANLENYRKQMIEMQESLGALVKKLPSDTEVPELLEDIDEKAVDSRLLIVSTDFGEEKPAEFYVELPIDIVVSGGYHEFGSFVSGVAGMPRIVTLHDFSIFRNRDNRNILTMNIQAKTYRYREQEEEI